MNSSGVSPRGLIVRVFPGAEGKPRHVKRHGEVGGFLVFQQAQHHRENPWMALVCWPSGVTKLSWEARKTPGRPTNARQ
jgi:hypothetical protein